jgi:hypothetical protein
MKNAPGAGEITAGGHAEARRQGDAGNRQCLCSFSSMPDMVEHIQPPFASQLFRPSPTRAVSSRRLTLRKILEVIRLLLVC